TMVPPPLPRWRPGGAIVRPRGELIMECGTRPRPPPSRRSPAMADAFLLSAARTPIGKYLGALSELSAPHLGAVAVVEAMKRAKAPPDRIDEVILGVVLQAGLGQNPARQAVLKAGLPDTIAAVTVNKVCGSGLKAVMLAAQALRAGDA